MLNAATIRLDKAGFALIELMVVIAITGVLLGLGLPSYQIWLENLKTRNSADSIQNGLRLAREEAARLNSNVEFVLTKKIPNNDTIANVSVPASDSGTNWLVRLSDGSGVYKISDYVQSRLGTDGSSDVVVNAAGTGGIITFTGLGRITAVADQVIKLSNAYGDRTLQVMVSRGGQIRMCDPDPFGHMQANDPRHC
jgi:type IV fimbrial biogenesis protein FimT